MPGDFKRESNMILKVMSNVLVLLELDRIGNTLLTVHLSYDLNQNLNLICLKI